ncbi:MAG: integration host factor subunit beta [Acidobacteria bacterium]|nr:integration host factor subunit beta [Acidobacteriota bacterium]
MVKADLVQRVMEAVDLDSLAARDAVDALLQCIGSALERGDRVVLRQFGMFHAAPRRTGVARNPWTNKPVAMPRGRVVRFRPAADLRNLPGDD